MVPFYSNFYFTLVFIALLRSPRSYSKICRQNFSLQFSWWELKTNKNKNLVTWTIFCLSSQRNRWYLLKRVFRNLINIFQRDRFPQNSGLGVNWIKIFICNFPCSKYSIFQVSRARSLLAIVCMWYTLNSIFNSFYRFLAYYRHHCSWYLLEPVAHQKVWKLLQISKLSLLHVTCFRNILLLDLGKP